MRIFCTGATGGLGRPLADLLKSQGHDLTLLSRRPLQPAHGERIVRGDLLASAGYAPALTGTQAVFHAAALTHSSTAADYFRINVEGTSQLLQNVKQACPQARFLFVSSRAAGPRCGAYGESKANAETLVRASGLDWCIVRLGEVYGASTREAVTRLMRSAAAGRFVLLPGNGGDGLAPVHIADILPALAAALVRPEASHREYLLAGPREYTCRGIVDMVSARAGNHPLVLQAPYWLLSLAGRFFAGLNLSRPPLVPDQVARLRCPKSTDISQAVRDLGFTPRSLEQALREGLA